MTLPPGSGTTYLLPLIIAVLGIAGLIIAA